MAFDALKREDFLYQPYYCEENIWHLCHDSQLINSYAVFIASKDDSFPMLNQRAIQNPLVPIYWDYHVVLLVLSEKNQILDFDTTLGFSVDIDTYFSQSFLLPDVDETPLFKLIPAGEFIASFSSDRSHMKTDSGWLASPPGWPLIGKSTSNFHRFIDMTNNDFGEVLTFDEVLETFA